MEAIRAILRDLTLEDVRTWAGGTIFNRGKGYVKKVGHLSRTAEGELVAWVSGSEEYATLVRLDADHDFQYSCTCPYTWGVCKHVVALVLAAAQRVSQQEDIPLLGEEDDLHLALFGDQDDDDAWGEDVEDASDKEADLGTGRPKSTGRLEAVLVKKSREELLALLMDAAERHPEIERRIRETEQLKVGKVDKLIRSLRGEIRNITAEPAWSDYWRDERNIPDYSHVGEQLKALLENGHADTVLQLGDDLFSRGQDQVEQSHDEGETAIEIATCLEVVLDALPQSSLTPPEKMLWMIDRALKDEFSLLESSGRRLQSGSYTEAHWREVAHILEARLGTMPRPSSSNFSETYRYGQIIDWLCTAYQRSGEEEKIIPLLEREVDASRKYEQLVNALLAAGEKERARQWCIQGHMRTSEQYPGIAHALQIRLRFMAEADKRYALVAAYRAQDLFERASGETYIELRAAAEKIGIWLAVRAGVLTYLETGQRPDLEDRGEKTAVWPLPLPEVQYPPKKGLRAHDTFPDFDVLIDIAILEERFDDVVEIYRALQKTKRRRTDTDKEVAQAVAKSHPQVALDIWRGIVDGLIGLVKPRAYEEAAVYLEHMRAVYMDTHRLDDWQALMRRLRVEHKPKRRLLAVLDVLEKKKIIS